MANASDLSATLSMHCIVAASCFFSNESCTPIAFDAYACTMSAYSLTSLTMSFFMVTISFLISFVPWITALSTIFSKSTLF